MKVKMFCYHGSPGTLSDFDGIATALQESGEDVFDIVPVARRGYPYESNESPVTGSFPGNRGEADRLVMIGYSWGVVPCLRDAALEPESVDAVVLVSPYLGGAHVGTIKSALLGFGPARKLLLGLMGGSVVKKLLVKSSAPDPVPESYSALARQLSQPDTLATAVLEKARESADTVEACRVLARRGCPSLVIWGGRDRNEGAGEYAARLIGALNAKELRIEGGGHALPWTRSREVAEAVAGLVADLAACDGSGQ